LGKREKEQRDFRGGKRATKVQQSKKSDPAERSYVPMKTGPLSKTRRKEQVPGNL